MPGCDDSVGDELVDRLLDWAVFVFLVFNCGLDCFHYGIRSLSGFQLLIGGNKISFSGLKLLFEGFVVLLQSSDFLRKLWNLGCFSLCRFEVGA